MPNKSLPTHWIVAALILVIVIAAGGYLLLHQARQATPAPAPAMSAAPPPAATAPAPAPHPISEASVSPAPASTTPLPALDDSDGMLRDALARFGGNASLLVGGSFIQRIVATVNALPGKRLPGNVLPVRSPRGTFLVDKDGDSMVMAPANAQRYARYAHVFEQADPQQVVDWYVHAYPLFEDAWHQLGYPKTQFNDRLVQVLDLLLKTPVPAQPPRLEGTAGLYRFVDPQLENLAIGQKILLRLGPTQETAVLGKLRAIRAKLVGRHPAAQ